MHVMLQPIATAGNLIGTNLDFARVESPHGAASAGLRLIDDVNAIRGDGSSHWARRAASHTVADGDHPCAPRLPGKAEEAVEAIFRLVVAAA
jgi:hypothetical protein